MNKDLNTKIDYLLELANSRLSRYKMWVKQTEDEIEILNNVKNSGVTKREGYLQ